MKQPKVSVIIPVYNTEEFVQEAVESILEQTLTDIEVIVINDGSTDRSLEILQQMEQADRRVRVYDQHNQGQSVARNNAIELAAGEYLYFMDSDDILVANALEVCYAKCRDYQLDFVYFNGDILNGGNKQYDVCLAYDHGNIDETHVQPGLVVLDNQLRDRHFTPSPCLLFIRKEFLQMIGLTFYPGIIHEDQLFTTRLYLAARRVMYVRRSFFLRRLRDNSTMTTRFAWRNVRGYLTVARELLAYANQFHSFDVDAVVRRHLRTMLDAVVWQAHVLPLRQRMRLFSVMMSKYRRFVSGRNLTVLLFKSTLHPNK